MNKLVVVRRSFKILRAYIHALLTWTTNKWNLFGLLCEKYLKPANPDIPKDRKRRPRRTENEN